jgi:hypothetical protein
MSKLLPNVYSYLKNVHRIVDGNESKELIYRICAYTGQEFDVSKEILEITFEEMLNSMIDKKGLLFSFGIVTISNNKFNCKTHKKFRSFYESRRKTKINT